MRFVDRQDAGRRLAELLRFRSGPDVVVVGLTRGGVTVAAEVAGVLGAPLDVVVVRKLGVPFQPELAMGAVAEGGVRVVDERMRKRLRMPASELAEIERREQAQVERRAQVLRGGRPPTPLGGRTAIVVDDGLATGWTARAGCRVARARGAARVVLAVPVAPAGSAQHLRPEADEVVCVASPAEFGAVGEFYADFRQVGDDEVLALLAAAARRTAPAPPRKGGVVDRAP